MTLPSGATVLGNALYQLPAHVLDAQGRDRVNNVEVRAAADTWLVLVPPRGRGRCAGWLASIPYSDLTSKMSGR